MKKTVGILFTVVGLLFAILGTIEYVITLMEKDDRIYATANIVKIDKQETGDPESPMEYTTYVELEADGERITAQLNTYDSSFSIGKQITVYYFENDLQMVYEKGSENCLVLFVFGGVAFATLGAVISFKRKDHIAQQ